MSLVLAIGEALEALWPEVEGVTDAVNAVTLGLNFSDCYSDGAQAWSIRATIELVDGDTIFAEIPWEASIDDLMDNLSGKVRMHLGWFREHIEDVRADYDALSQQVQELTDRANALRSISPSPLEELAMAVDE